MATTATLYGETLDLTEPRQADRFLVYWRGSYRAAANCGWADEFLLAQRVVSKAIWDETNKGRK